MFQNWARCLLTLAILMGLTHAAIAATAPTPSPVVLAAAQDCEGYARDLLGRLVGIDTGTGDADGIARIDALLRTELEQIGARVENVAAVAPAIGDNLVATLSGSGRGRILLIAHMDTVFAHGTVADRPYRVVDGHGIGAGAGDDKSGIVSAICALRSLRQLTFHDFATLTLILNSNEETGSLGTRDLIRAKARDADVALNLERGLFPDGVEVARKGSAVLTLALTGRAAHSGLEPEKGRNAALEAAHQALRLGTLSDPGHETTVNVTILQGGRVTNAIPDQAIVKADVRAFTTEEFDRVERQARALATDTLVPEVTVTVAMDRTFPPWPHSASTAALLARAQALYAELGRSLDGTAVGGSADVAYAAETGTPTLDGLGMRGAGGHTDADFADLTSIVPRIYLLTRMIMDLGRNPPQRTAAH